MPGQGREVVEEREREVVVSEERAEERVQEAAVKKQFKASGVNDSLPGVNNLDEFVLLTGVYVYKGELVVLHDRGDDAVFNRYGVKTIVPLSVWFEFTNNSALGYQVDAIELRKVVRELVAISDVDADRLEGPSSRSQLQQFIRKQNKLNRKWLKRVEKNLRLSVADVELGKTLPSYFKVFYVFVARQVVGGVIVVRMR